MRLSPVYLLIIPALAAQAPAPEVKPTDPKNLAKLEGRTLHGVSGEPVRKVGLTLRRSPLSVTIGPMSSQPASALSDAEGRFIFENVEPGTYMLFAERTGFLRQMYGSRSQLFSGTPITLSAGQHMKALEFKLTPQGVIAGKVVDEEGEPLPRAMITASRQIGGPQGRAGVGGMGTDDRGEFRIANLGPGKYFITAVYRQGMFGSGGPTSAPATPGQPEEGYVPTHYPGVTDLASASTIDVGPGQEVSGIVIQMRRSRVYRIRGKVQGVQITSGMNRTSLQLIPRQIQGGMGMPFGGSGAALKPDGTFEVMNVQPGSYNLVLMSFGEGRPQPLGRVTVDVTDANVENVVIQAAEPVEITGVVRIEGVDKPEYRGSINLSAAESLPMGMTMGEIKPDGTFRITGVGRERYYINLFNTPEGTYLRSVKLGSQEAKDLVVDLSGASAVTAIELTLSVKAATLEGLVKQADKPAPGMFVVAVPDPFRIEQRFLMKTAMSDQTGRFKVTGIAPGRYRVWAFEEPPQIGYNFDPAVFKPVEDKAVKIDASEGSREQVELTVVKFETR